jgi:hypothetical protein
MFFTAHPVLPASRSPFDFQHFAKRPLCRFVTRLFCAEFGRMRSGGTVSATRPYMRGGRIAFLRGLRPRFCPPSRRRIGRVDKRHRRERQKNLEPSAAKSGLLRQILLPNDGALLLQNEGGTASRGRTRGLKPTRPSRRAVDLKSAARPCSAAVPNDHLGGASPSAYRMHNIGEPAGSHPPLARGPYRFIWQYLMAFRTEWTASPS